MTDLDILIASLEAGASLSWEDVGYLMAIIQRGFVDVEVYEFRSFTGDCGGEAMQIKGKATGWSASFMPPLMPPLMPYSSIDAALELIEPTGYSLASLMINRYDGCFIIRLDNPSTGDMQVGTAKQIEHAILAAALRTRRPTDV